MNRTISKHELEAIRSRNDIVDVIGEYLDIKRSGSVFKALCPFHKEKAPSFHIKPMRQIFHCSGCGAGGDVFGFLMQYKKVDFATAAKILAQRTGVRQKRSEILVTIEIGESEIVTRVVERVDRGDEVFLGQGRAAVNDAMKNGVIVDERLMKQAIRQSLEEAEPNARVSIHKVSLQHSGKIDMERLRQIVRSIPMEICGEDRSRKS